MDRHGAGHRGGGNPRCRLAAGLCAGHRQPKSQCRHRRSVLRSYPDRRPGNPRRRRQTESPDGVNAFGECRMVAVRRSLGPTNSRPTAQPPPQTGICRRPCPINYLSSGLEINGIALGVPGESLNDPWRWHRKPLSAGSVDVMINTYHYMKIWGYFRANLSPHPRRSPMARALGRGPSGAWRAPWRPAGGRKG